jgi:hypothetical protein
VGQEWNASTPFQFFADHNQKLGQSINDGRRREFDKFVASSDRLISLTIPDPQDEKTFANSKLRWEELKDPQHAQILRLYREFLVLRQTQRGSGVLSREDYSVLELDDGIVAILFGSAAEYNFAVLTDLVGGHDQRALDDKRIAPGLGRDWKSILSSNEKRFGGTNDPPFTVRTTLVLAARGMRF